MEVGAAAAGVSAGMHALWGYNRKNFLFDREMRQKNEYQVLDWRRKQAALWRDDVRDLIELTEKKMDKYTIVSALQLGMCVALFTEGRLAPGTPPWLLHFYMLTLAAAFLYLLMSVWLAMHASVVAQCCSVRLLTQFVRLPVPTWEELENMRTYAQSFEQVRGKHMLRVPFVNQTSGSTGSGSSSVTPLETSTTPERRSVVSDPWETELHGDHRDIYELQKVPASLRRHIQLARRAADQYKCFDAFARVAMTFGTNQMLQAITYYCLGYASVQDGAPWAAWCVGTIMSTISVAMFQLDVSLKRQEQFIAQVLVLGGPACASCATWLWARHGKEAATTILILLPMAYAAHALWLLWALQACGVEQLPCGSTLPTRFRAVLYLDVFGWMGTEQEARQPDVLASSGYQLCRDQAPKGCPEAHHAPGQVPDTPDMPNPNDLSQLQHDVREQIALWQSDKVQCAMDEQEKARVAALAQRFHTAKVPRATSPPSGQSRQRSPQQRSPWVKLHGYSDFGVEAPYLYDPDSGAVADIHASQQHGGSAASGSGEQQVRTITFAEEEVERFCSHATVGGQAHSKQSSPPRARPSPELHEDAELPSSLWCWDVGSYEAGETRVPAEDKEQEAAAGGPQRDYSQGPIPSHAFAPATFVPHASSENESAELVTGHDRLRPGQLPWRVFNAATLLLAALWATGMAIPLSPFKEMMTNPVIEEIHVQSMSAEGGSGVEKFAVGTDPSGLPEYIPETDLTSIPELPEGELIKATWPSHEGFKPRALSRAPHGQQLVVADDFGVYVGQLFEEEAEQQSPTLRGKSQPSVVHSVHFRKAPPCAALEGHALKDISVACTEGDSPVCRVLVLHTHGRRLVSCPLFSPEIDGSVMGGEELLRPSRPSLKWEIASDWLHGHSKDRRESVESVAVDNECLGGAFNANKVGCVVVGTTSGRIVQMRGHLTNETRLVPERAVQQYSRSVEHGSLHVLPNGYVVALHKRTGTIEAFDAHKGQAVGEWRLPRQEVNWMTVSGGGDNLYVMGQRRNDTDFDLYRFPVPDELRREKSSGRLEFGSRPF